MRIVLYLCFALILSSCSDDQADPRFQISGDMILNIPANLGTVETHSFFIREQNTFIDALLTQNNLSKEDITAILPSTATFTSRNTSVNLDFINEISVRAWSRVDDNVNIELFYLQFVEFNEDNQIRMLPSIADVKSIMLEDRYDIEVRLTLRRFSPANFTCDLNFKVDAFVE